MTTTWSRHVHEERVWGTVITFDLRDEGLDAARAREASAAAAEELHCIDAWLSPFREDSAVSLIRKDPRAQDTCPPPVREVIAACSSMTRLTRGAFDPWRAPGGFDPSGYVKGWGADRAAEILVAHGIPNVSVNAAGDVTCRGRAHPEADGWRIGVADPRDRHQIVGSVLVRDAHLATSGRYEQGDHIVDPRTGRPVIGVDSATVLAADGGLADAVATALMVDGPAGLAHLVDRPISAQVISRGCAWTIGPAFTTGSAARAA